jgi:uncharacterized membrane protein
LDAIEKALFGNKPQVVQSSVMPEPVSIRPADTVAPVVSENSQEQTKPAYKANDAEAISAGRILGYIGIGAVFIGVAFFLKYAFDNNWITPTGRVLMGVVAGFALIGIGQYLRKKYVEYSDLMVGGGMALLYLSIYFANSFYHLITPFNAGLFMSLVTALGFVISAINSTKVLGIVSIIGGCLVPIMTATNQNEMMSLFVYLSVLSTASLFLGYIKKWHEFSFLSLMGMIFNFGIWYSAFYNLRFLVPTISFVFFMFLLYTGFLTGKALKKEFSVQQGDILSLLGISGFMAIMVYVLLYPSHHNLLAPVALIIAVIYSIIALMANEINREERNLNLILPGLAVMYLSLAIFFHFKGSWIAVMWVVESVILYGVATKISSRGLQVSGAFLYFLGVLRFLFVDRPFVYERGFVAFGNVDFLVFVFLIACAYGIAYIYKVYGSTTVENQKNGITAFTVTANILTIMAVTLQIAFYFKSTQGQAARNYSNMSVSIFWALYASLLTAIGFIKRSRIRRFGLFLFVLTALKVAYDIWDLGQVYRIVTLIAFGAIALVVSFAYAKYKDRIKEVI